MSWDDSLLPEQVFAASHTGTHSRLLAGPGTGKTLVITRRLLYLIHKLAIPANQILSLTFTRAAAQELRRRVADDLGIETDQPRILTLHSFALRQLLKNSNKLHNLPQPLRIADDWEERNIIQEDIKRILNLDSIDEVKELFNQLSSDWQSLDEEHKNNAPDPHFIGAWTQHRSNFGYTLRSELVFQLKRALEQISDFSLEAPLQHLLVDEYQDLNKCDLAVIRELVNSGLELFIAGDDDQSIYGFRKANPDGIRSFLSDYPGSVNLPLEVCKRCDSKILELAEFVASLDTERIPKVTRTESGAAAGEVELLRFSDEYEEAKSVARLCDCLIRRDNYSPSDILILSRVDTHNAFSRILKSAFDEISVPFTADLSTYNPLNGVPGRIILSILRLLRNLGDHLAWRTILRLKTNRIGDGTINSLLDLCRRNGYTFYQLLGLIQIDPTIVSKYGNHITEEVGAIQNLIQDLQTAWDMADLNHSNFNDLLIRIAQWSTNDPTEQSLIKSYIVTRTADSDFSNLTEALSLLESTDEDIEQEINPNSVNMLTMHKAKGLTSKAVIILAAEDELIPGRQETEPNQGDERRLLFVSLSRAKHKLFVSYCTHRRGQQKWLGRTGGSTRRTLTRFLQYAPIRPLNGNDFVRDRYGL